ncbi:hypothetical protein evm_001679 [Chilo suppressalis]|nr:hypothetical protein evm_001679 [Chilo suppressalis]
MNKYLLFLLAVCLVSVHAYVKRDAPAPAENQNYFQDIQKHLEDFSKTVNDKLKESFNPDDIQKNFNEFTKNVNKVIDNFKEKKA